MQLTIRWQDQGQFDDKTISEREVIGIGRDKNDSRNHVFFSDQRVSRHHATLSAKSGKWYLRNVSSRNIVRKGGYRVDPGNEVTLNEGDIFNIGPIEFHAVSINRKGKTGRQVTKLRCERCQHIVDHKPHDFCPWCGLSLSTAVTVQVSE